MAETSTPKLSVTVQKLRSVLAEIQKDAEGLKEYDQLWISRNSLRDELERKNRELEVKSKEIREVNEQMKDLNMQMNRKIEKASNFRKQLLQAHEERYSGWEREKERHSKDAEQMSQLKQKLKTAHETAEKLSGTNSDLQNQLNELGTNIVECKSNWTSAKVR